MFALVSAKCSGGGGGAHFFWTHCSNGFRPVLFQSYFMCDIAWRFHKEQFADLLYQQLTDQLLTLLSASLPSVVMMPYIHCFIKKTIPLISLHNS